MEANKFRARLAWCTVGSRGMTREQALAKCQELKNDTTAEYTAQPRTAELHEIYTGQLRRIVGKMLATREEGWQPSNSEDAIRYAEALSYWQHPGTAGLYWQLSMFAVVLQFVKDDEEEEEEEIEEIEEVEIKVEEEQVEVVQDAPDRTCAICMHGPRTHAFLPCGHILCQRCSTRCLEAKQCPICRKVAQCNLRVYL